MKMLESTVNDMEENKKMLECMVNVLEEKANDMEENRKMLECKKSAAAWHSIATPELKDEDKNLFVQVVGLPGSGKSSALSKAMVNYKGGEYKTSPIKHVVFNFEGKNFVHLGSLRDQYPGTDSLPYNHQPIKDFMGGGLQSRRFAHHRRRTEADQFSLPRARRELVQHRRDLHRGRREHCSQSCSSSRWLRQGVQANVFEESDGRHPQYQILNASQFSAC